jgi:hypothetical protein
LRVGPRRYFGCQLVPAVLLLIDVNEARSSTSSSRRIDAVTFCVIPKIIYTFDTLELRNLLAALGIQDDQHRRVVTAAEKTMMGLVERQRDNT